MREVNNNTANASQVNFQAGINVRKDEPEVKPQMVETTETTDLGKMPSEVIGRSQVAKSSLQKDLEFFTKNPEQVEQLNKFCDYLMQEVGMSYEEATATAIAAGIEFYHNIN